MNTNTYQLIVNTNTYQLTLLITERCNLHCAYCYCNGGSRTVMTFEVAKQAIDEVVALGHKHVKLLLMGGEPFLNFKLLREVVEYAEKHCEVVQIKTVSNGTLIHGEIQDWLIQHRESLFVSLSLDGDRESHNRNRCNSYDQIDFPFFIQTYGKNAEANMVVVPDNLDNLSHNVQYVEQMGFRVKCVLADDEGWIAERDCPRLAEQLDKLIQHYTTHPEVTPFTMLREPLDKVEKPSDEDYCKPFENTHCVAPDGQHYACHRCTPYYNNGAWKIAEIEKVSADGGIMDGCSECVAKHICCVCPALTHSLRSNRERATTMCKLFRVVHRANAAFVAQLFLEHPQHPYIQQLPRPVETISGAQSILNKLHL